MEKEYKKINGHDPTIGPWKMTDYLRKDLPTELQQRIWHKLDWDCCAFLEELAEKDMGYPALREMGYSETEISRIEEEATAYFREVNAMMTENGRYPLFPDPEDAGGSAKLYFDLVKQRSYEEIVQLFGCEYPDYKPAKLNNGTFKPGKDRMTYQYQGYTYVFRAEGDSVILHPIWEGWKKVVTIRHAELIGEMVLRSAEGKIFEGEALSELLATAIDNKQSEVVL